MDSISSPLPTLTTLLPLIFTPAPQELPNYLIARPAREAHRFLGCRPGESEYYCLPGASNKDNVEKEKERLVQVSIENLSIGEPSYSVEPELGEVRASITIDHRLVLLLQWEALNNSKDKRSEDPESVGEEDIEDSITFASWKFLTLALPRCPLVTTANSYPSLAAALEASLTASTRASSTATSDPNYPYRGTADLTSPPTAIDIGHANHCEEHNKRKNNTKELAEGEGTTPGAYGAPEDFWDGWSSDGELNERGDQQDESRRPELPTSRLDRQEFGTAYSSDHLSAIVNDTSAGSDEVGSVSPTNHQTRLNGVGRQSSQAEGEGDDNDDGYWDQYGGVETVIGEQHQGELEGEKEQRHGRARDAVPKVLKRSRRSSTIKPSTNAAGSTSPAQPLLISTQNTSLPSLPASTERETNEIKDSAAMTQSRFLKGPLLTKTDGVSGDATTPRQATASLIPTAPLTAAHGTLVNGRSSETDSDKEESNIGSIETPTLDDEDEGLRLALQGLWKLYSGSGTSEATCSAQRTVKKQVWEKLTREILL